MYARRVNDKPLTFTVSGMLWEGSLVMQDTETKSLWSHLLGEAMHGKLKGTKLKTLPSMMTTWKSWKERHPSTTVAKLPRTAQEYDSELARHHPDMLIALVGGKKSRAWRFNDLKTRVVVNDSVSFAKGPAGKEVVVVYDDANGSAVIRDRRVDGRILTFEWKDALIDRETKSKWDLVTGTATSGPLKGKTLKLMPGIVSFGIPWRAFHPSSTYWLPPKPKK